MPSGHYDSATDKYWTYIHSFDQNQQQSIILRAIHAAIDKEVRGEEFFAVITGPTLGLAEVNVESPSFAVNTYGMIPAAAEKPIVWKPYFTLDPEEGLNFVYDSTSIEWNAGVAKLAIAPSDQPMLYYSARPDKTNRLKNDGRMIEPLTDSPDLLHGDGGFIYLRDCRIRYVTEEPAPGNTQQRHISRIVSYLSSDAIHWSREPGIRYQPGSTDDSISSVPSVLQLSDSLWRMYYVGDFYRSNGIRTAISRDWGMTWTAESNGNIMRKGDVDPHPVYLSDGRVRLYHRTGFNSPSQTDPGPRRSCLHRQPRRPSIPIRLVCLSPIRSATAQQSSILR